ncbi:MAG: type II toxin-antitoxin system RelE/ParE family toxin [Candidatus Delongbacteria bacterium]|jgi:proteic killer suppression protein|nr:type II toxin-antitoxin system RelE/ParE family toxin [Candidatus Delongbacteria bacterium]
MIKSFKDTATKNIWEGVRSLKLPGNIQQIARRKLRMINNAHELKDLMIPPSNMLEKLKGDRKGYYSIRINQQWRICFKWDSDAYEVEITDYH